MTNLMITIVLVALLSGCAAGVETVRDFSTGDETALIHGNDGTIFLPKGTCEIIWPHFANSMVVDAGPVTFVEFCSNLPFNMDGHRIEVMAVFRFHAKAGHTYQTKATIKDGCMTLLDVTASSYVVACEPYFDHRFKDLSTGDNKAVVRSIGATGYNYCAVTMEQKRFGFLFVDAGSNTIDVICRKTGTFGGHPRILTSSFDFEAQAGHTYTFSAEDDECIRLLDITSDESVIACEPYEQRDEEK